MVRKRINTRSHTKEKPYMINSYFLQNWLRQKRSIGWAKYVCVCMYVSEICTEEIDVSFPCWLKNVKSRSKIALFLMSAILKFDFQKRKQIHFSEKTYLNYTKKTQFCMWQLHFPYNKGKQDKQWTHLGALKELQMTFQTFDVSICNGNMKCPPGIPYPNINFSHQILRSSSSSFLCYC